MSTVAEIENALQRIPVHDARKVAEWLQNYLEEKWDRLSDAPMNNLVTDTWEKLGPPPDVDYNKL